MDANIGHKIYTTNGDTSMVRILNIVPVQYKDNGEEQGYEICEPSKTDLAMFQEAPLAQSRPTFMPLKEYMPKEIR